MSIIWLASYPKSGNTWLRFLLYNYFYGRPQTSDDVARAIPDLHRASQLNPNQAGTVFCKTHFAYSPQHPYPGSTAGFIYLLRHPKDILLSSFNYCRLEGDDQHTEQEFAREFIRHMGVSKWRSVGFGSWPEHVRSWLENPALPHLVLRYEDMLESPRDSFKKVLDFLNVEIDDRKLNQAVYRSSFKKLKALEEHDKSDEKGGSIFYGAARPSVRGLRFINKGKSRKSLIHLGADIEEQFDERFRDVLEHLGYT